MAFCLKAGIRHDEFLAWPDIERSKMLAKVLRDETIHSCGTRTSEWYDDEGRLQDPEPYEIQIMECRGCEILSRQQDTLKNTASDRYYLTWKRTIDNVAS